MSASAPVSSQLWVTRPVPAKISMHRASRPARSSGVRGAQDDLAGRASQALGPQVLKVRHLGSSARRPNPAVSGEGGRVGLAALALRHDVSRSGGHAGSGLEEDGPQAEAGGFEWGSMMSGDLLKPSPVGYPREAPGGACGPCGAKHGRPSDALDWSGSQPPRGFPGLELRAASGDAPNVESEISV